MPDGDEATVLAVPRVAAGVLLDGRYRLGGRIGAGGMATIFRARDELLERDVAVKVLHAHLADDEELLARFRTEARHAAALSHPHIVDVYDQGVAELPYIVMELVEGPSLRDVLRERGSLDVREALAILGPVCSALARAHDAGVIHRDVKPENVLVGPEGRPKVADFGIARVVAATSHTQTGALIGSVHYLAPELLDGREASPASDQYAVGVLLYELLTGERPLPADSPMAIALRHAREDVPPPSTQSPDCPPAVDRVVAQATARDPDERFTDLRALAAALAGAVPAGPSDVVVPHATGDDAETLVIPAEHDSIDEHDRPDRRRRRAGRRPFVWLTALLLFAGGIAGGGFAAWNWVIAPVVDVPELTGLEQDRALEITGDLGLGLLIDRRVHRLDVPEGVVVAQQPEPGTQRRRGEDVGVAVSRGPRRVQLKSVTGLTRDQALRRLGGNAFELEVRRRHHDTVPAGRVIGQQPGPGSAVEQGSAVELLISRGIEQVTVPDLAGKSRKRARRLLEQVGLEGSFTEQYSDEYPDPGTVFGQDIPAERSVDKGTTVSANVSLGPLTVLMPNVRGLPVDDAQAELEAAGLDVTIEGQSRQTFGPFVRGSVGLVEEQLPQPDEAVQRGDIVTLYTYTE